VHVPNEIKRTAYTESSYGKRCECKLEQPSAWPILTARCGPQLLHPLLLGGVFNQAVLMQRRLNGRA
jgi:hypothetical protein